MSLFQMPNSRDMNTEGHTVIAGTSCVDRSLQCLPETNGTFFRKNELFSLYLMTEQVRKGKRLRKIQDHVDGVRSRGKAMELRSAKTSEKSKLSGSNLISKVLHEKESTSENGINNECKQCIHSTK